MRYGLCRHIWGFEGEYLIIERRVHCTGFKYPPDHPGGIALI